MPFDFNYYFFVKNEIYNRQFSIEIGKNVKFVKTNIL